MENEGSQHDLVTKIKKLELSMSTKAEVDHLTRLVHMQGVIATNAEGVLKELKNKFQIMSHQQHDLEKSID